MKNDQTPSGTAVITAGATELNLMGLTVITASDLVYIDSLGATTTLAAVPAGVTINCRIRRVTTCTGVVLGYLP